MPASRFQRTTKRFVRASSYDDITPFSLKLEASVCQYNSIQVLEYERELMRLLTSV